MFFTSWLFKLGGEIIIDKESRTNIKGVYAAGDVTDTRFKQAITGVGEGVGSGVGTGVGVGVGTRHVPNESLPATT